MGTRPRKALALALIIALAFASCSDDPSPTGATGQVGGSDNPGTGSDAGAGVDPGSGTDPGAGGDPGTGTDPGAEPVVIGVDDDEIALTSQLVRFDGCNALLDQLRNWAADRVGPWGFDGRPFDGTDDMIVEEAEPTASTTLPAEPAADFQRQPPVEGVDYSGTNVQEAGVDEADIVKTDGRRIIAMSAGHLVVVDATRREVLGSVLLPVGESAELFLTHDGLMAIQQSSGSGGNPPQAVIHRIDVRDGVPEIAETLRVEGRYVSARSIGGVARVMVRSRPADDFPFVHPAGPDSEAVAEEANRAAMLATTLEDWLPAYSHTSPGGATTEGLLAPCRQVHAPTVFSGFGVTTVLSVPVAGAIDPAAATSVLAPGETVYASTRSMYVSTATWIDPAAEAGDIDWDQFAAEFRTNLHRFDISDPAGAVYTASGSVPGEIHNQFALSEHAGHLRVVTTTGQWDASESSVRVLAESNGRLVEVGSVGDIGRGERVQSVRFAGDIGYVVTFRQIDPFYTIDLSDPTAPAVVGELKIPGFSSYLHPLGEGLVLGVGSDADEDGRVTGAKVSLFDVSDLADPQEVSVWTAPGGWNEIGWDHRAFLWWAPERLAVLPVTVDHGWSGAVVLHIGDDALTEYGRIVHLGPGAGQTSCRRLSDTDVIGPVDVTQADLGTRVAELIAQTPSTAVIVACEPGEEPIAGFHCEVGVFSQTEEESLRQRVSYTADEDLWACLPPAASEVPARKIVRSIVIGDDLWTLSHPYERYRDGSTDGLLQVNGLETLEFLDAVDI